jgi:hypothetical protein
MHQQDIPSAKEGAGLARRVNVTAVMMAKCFRLSDRLEPSESLDAKRFVDRKATLGEPVVTKASVDATANKRAMLTRSFMILDYGSNKIRRDNENSHGVIGVRSKRSNKRQASGKDR